MFSLVSWYTFDMENNQKNQDFLQSAEWAAFQKAAGKKTFLLESGNFSASLIMHELPIVGKYLYCPRGPIFCHPEFISGSDSEMLKQVQHDIKKLIDLAKKENAGWIRIEPENEEILENTRKNIPEKIVKAPHDMQPKENFVLDITKSIEQLLSEMKSKTRYNIGVAQKRGVKIYSCQKNDMECARIQKYFFRLTKEMAERNRISTHPEGYYKQMIESIPADMLKIYAAEYDGKIIAANLIVFFGNTVIYLHGASSNENRNVMAPFLLQWQAILDAKEKGFSSYDFGGIKTGDAENSWAGITQFKTGFSLKTKPLVFPGSYDIIINPRKYALYRTLQIAKSLVARFRK